MTKSKKKKPLPPRAKRMQRPARLQSARNWIPTYTGKNLLRGYCNHYAVDWRCAAIELKILGLAIDPNDIAQREETDAELTRCRQEKRQSQELLQNGREFLHPDAFSAYLNDDFPALHEFEMRDWQAVDKST